MAGISAISTTVLRSSARLVPIMTRPGRVCSSPRSMRSRLSTMVLETESTAPSTRPSLRLSPASGPARAPSAVTIATPRGPPKNVTQRRRSSSRSENSMPMENIRSTTPTWANRSNERTSETDGPGVNGLTASPPRT
jgi:hypothetical protein